MTALVAILLILVGLAGTAVALTRTLVHQIILISFLGLALTMLFVALQAPEVALSQLAVGAVIVPLLFLAALVRASRSER